MTSLEIYNNHLKAFKEETITIFTKNKNVQSSSHLKELLLNGELIGELFFKCIENSQTVTEQMFINTLLKFSSQRTENKTKVIFIKTLNKLGIQ